MPASENHVVFLGKLVGNLQSLELTLRTYLGWTGPPARDDTYRLADVKTGDEVDVDQLTNYDTLDRLVARYNRHVAGVDRTLRVDPTVVELRDAIAHGRVLAFDSVSLQLHIVTFGKPRGGRVRVKANIAMTDAWLDGRVKFLYEQLCRVGEAYDRLIQREIAAGTPRGLRVAAARASGMGQFPGRALDRRTGGPHEEGG